MEFYTEIVTFDERTTTGSTRKIDWEGMLQYPNRPLKGEIVVKGFQRYKVLDVEHRLGQGLVADKTVIILTPPDSWKPPF